MARPTIKTDDCFGSLMVKARFINQQELEAALKIQAEGDSHRKLGDILIEMGACTEQEIKVVMATQTHLRNGGLDICEMMEKASNTEDVQAEADEIVVISGNLAKKMKR